ncbi:SCO3374 family protein [Streptomyces chrestomyceticus]|uniref:SCO3374 family protein n=1 Tax=Streptomyces chrestomyceticus TaxID=68185 RepID=UPI0035A94327
MPVALPRSRSALAAVRQWYEDELRWPTTGTEPVELLTGVRFDTLDLPADAGRAVLGRVGPTGPVLIDRSGSAGPRMLVLVTAGAAEELPELLEWLEWGSLGLDLTARGTGDRMPAPSPPPPSPQAWWPYGSGPREAAGWVRPPEPGREIEAALPTTGTGAGRGGRGVPLTDRQGRAPDLVRLVSAAATECHRARLLRGRQARRQTDCGYGGQPFAFSNASRISAGTRPRSLTL